MPKQLLVDRSWFASFFIYVVTSHFFSFSKHCASVHINFEISTLQVVQGASWNTHERVQDGKRATNDRGTFSVWRAADIEQWGPTSRCSRAESYPVLWRVNPMPTKLTVASCLNTFQSCCYQYDYLQINKTKLLYQSFGMRARARGYNLSCIMSQKKFFLSSSPKTSELCQRDNNRSSIRPPVLKKQWPRITTTLLVCPR